MLIHFVVSQLPQHKERHRLVQLTYWLQKPKKAIVDCQLLNSRYIVFSWHTQSLTLKDDTQQILTQFIVIRYKANTSLPSFKQSLKFTGLRNLVKSNWFVIMKAIAILPASNKTSTGAMYLRWCSICNSLSRGLAFFHRDMFKSVLVIADVIAVQQNLSSSNSLRS